ncbi:hypothetical protein [Agriterribacter sp.]|uniref:hypothetical protein n=1 Tax=Agriterribacter sp. TaxID=2821509 RepID=UPI002C9631AC|nr:hypothetical protein [Agriterribacter sp.]HTN08280.1 hypothetical protein [Agriterribacter sp.]
MIHYVKQTFLTSVACCLMLCAAAQAVIPGTEIMEMVQLAESYRHAKNLSFNVDIKYTDSLDTDTTIEQISANYKLHGGYYYTYIDSTEIVQGNRYSLRVSHTDSVISIRSRQTYPDVMNMPVTDTLYWKTFVQSLTVTAVNDSVRTLKIKFKPGALYSSYEVKYNFKRYRMTQVKAYMPADLPGTDPDLFPSGKAVITFTFSGYDTSLLDAGWFNEDKYIIYQGGQFQPKAPYTGYFIETNITQ